MERNISPKRARDLLRVLYERDPLVLDQIGVTRWLMGEDRKGTIGCTEAVIHYLQFDLDDENEGYIDCFLEYIPEGQLEIATDPNAHCEKGCYSVKQICGGQVHELEGEILTHKYYLGREVGYDVGGEIAEKDFFDKHIEKWRKGFRDCFDERVCVARDNCKRKVKDSTGEGYAVKQTALSS